MHQIGLLFEMYIVLLQTTYIWVTLYGELMIDAFLPGNGLDVQKLSYLQWVAGIAVY